MSYQVLARKYRPKSFETLVGQEHVVRALTHALEQQRLHHAYLFTGTRGVGKTTLSRILAKSLNCETGITAKPCGVCEACTAIDAGRFVDYIEMDAASNRGVDEMAQLLEQAVYAPSNARFKVYMIDEVHMLTNHAFNSMLKTLEEPPEHVKFILATTDPQKIPVTVLSRCLQFNLKQMPPGHIVGHLEDILGQENIEFDAPALRLLAQGAHGSMRDALSLTDQAIAYAAGKVTLDAVQGMLGALDQSYLIRVLDALAAKDGAGLLAVADEMATRSLSYNAALQDLGTLLHRLALAQTVPAALPDDVPEREDILRLAGMFDAEEIQLHYQIAVHGRNELSLAPDEYAGFSMTLLRMLAFRPGMGGAERVAQPPAPPVPARASGPAATLANRTPMSSAPVSASAAPALTPARSAGISPARAALEAARNGGKSQPAAMPARPVPSTPSTPSASLAPPVSSTLPPWEEDMPAGRDAPAFDSLPVAAQKKTEVRSQPQFQAQPQSQSLIQSDTAVLEEPPIIVVPELPVADVQPLASTPMPSLNWDGNWPVLAAALPLRGVVQQLAQQSELLQCEDKGEAVLMHLRIPLETLRSAGAVDKLTAALTEHFSKTVRVTTEIGTVQQTANAQAVAEREARQRQAEESLTRDPFVQTMMREFGATIVPGSIKPA
ncbi:DNA polymerase III subunit gamma/tau [Herbaspirillum sp. GCM10030257]|uniref:DNA polymerase III subunit gamma/tau n=1 Tax=Herbaspirillum sp. GCM10030257 TaxID=3273393 RepID=UPI00361C6A54